MRAVAVASELHKLGAEIAPGAGGVVLRFPQGNKPPADLIEAARSIKPALGVLALKSPSPEMFIALGLPEAISIGLASLLSKAPPSTIPAPKWQDMTRSARAVAVEWASPAIDLGWSATDLFGLHPGAPLYRLDATGLAFMVSAADSIIAISAETAKIRRADSVEQSFNRKNMNEESRPAWEIQ